MLDKGYRVNLVTFDNGQELKCQNVLVGARKIKKKFGDRVRELRLEANLSQEKFALLIDMDRTYLASVENGKRNISLENIAKIANGFNITIEELFKGM